MRRYTTLIFPEYHMSTMHVKKPQPSYSHNIICQLCTERNHILDIHRISSVSYACKETQRYNNNKLRKLSEHRDHDPSTLHYIEFKYHNKLSIYIYTASCSLYESCKYGSQIFTMPAEHPHSWRH